MAKTFSVVKIGSKQYKVSKGDVIRVPKLKGEVGEKLDLDQVLLKSGSKLEIGQPVLAKTEVTGQIVEQGKGKKIEVLKFKAKSRYRRKLGFRPQLTKLKILTA